MSLPILNGAGSWPQVLLARAAEGEVADIEAAEAKGAWEAYRKATSELTPEVTTGVPAAIASSGGRPKPSWSEGKAKAEAAS